MGATGAPPSSRHGLGRPDPTSQRPRRAGQSRLEHRAPGARCKAICPRRAAARQRSRSRPTPRSRRPATGHRRRHSPCRSRPDACGHRHPAGANARAHTTRKHQVVSLNRQDAAAKSREDGNGCRKLTSSICLSASWAMSLKKSGSAAQPHDRWRMWHVGYRLDRIPIAGMVQQHGSVRVVI